MVKLTSNPSRVLRVVLICFISTQLLLFVNDHHLRLLFLYPSLNSWIIRIINPSALNNCKTNYDGQRTNSL